jgi:hypothetical protein
MGRVDSPQPPVLRVAVGQISQTTMASLLLGTFGRRESVKGLTNAVAVDGVEESVLKVRAACRLGRGIGCELADLRDDTRDGAAGVGARRGRRLGRACVVVEDALGQGRCPVGRLGDGLGE